MENTEPNPLPTETDPSRLTLADIYDTKIFETVTLRQPHWMPDSRRFSYLEKAPDSEALLVWMYHLDTGEKVCLTPLDSLKTEPPQIARHGPNVEETEAKDTFLTIPGYQWSPDETQLLFAKLPHRRQFGKGDGSLFLYTIATHELTPLTDEDANYLNAKWSPDGKRLGYVKGDDLYLQEGAKGKPIRLTDTAAKAIYNGRFGWVYEEEIEISDGWNWSPDGNYIAYFQTDETHVPPMDLPDYDDLHSKPTETRYPKAGDPNPVVRIGVITLADVADGKIPTTRWIDIGADSDIYIARMQWTPDNRLLLQRIPRLQNKIELLLADPKTGLSNVILTETDKAWVDLPGELKFVGKTPQFLWPSDRSGFKHFYLYDLSGKLIRQVTAGEFDTDDVVGTDAVHRMAYFTAFHPEPTEKRVFATLLDGGGDSTCLTETPGHHSALFAPDGSHFLATHSAKGVPHTTRLCRSTGQHLAVLLENPLPKLAPKKLAAWELLKIKTASGLELNAAMLKPADFDPKKKYPVIMHTYGGPGSQVVQNHFGSGGGLEQYLAQEGYIFFCVDGRGSGGRGRDFMKGVYLNLGKQEVEDQIEAAKWIGSQPFVDARRIGIWGWSYGGYMTSLCITRGADVFASAIAVAPVTHWTLYDSIYTERYMRRPSENPDGYATTSPLTETEKLKGHFLLVHGLADDNVHFQNAARLAFEFQKRSLPFEMMVYPGKKHGIEGVSKHVFTLITDFFKRTL